MPNYPKNHGGPDNGGTRAFFDAADAGMLWPWDWTPELMWEARISYRDLTGPAATQIVAITIPATGFVSGSITATFTGYGLSSPVAVTAYAAVADDEEDLTAALDMAIDDLIATTLAGVVASVDSATNVTTISLAAGIASGTVTVAWRSAQQVSATWGGTLLDGPYSVRLVNEAEELDVTIDNDRAAASPVDADAMAAAFETAATTLIGTTLADVLVSAAATDDVNLLIFEPDYPTVTLSRSVAPGTSLTFGGTETDGAYATTFVHSSIPAGSATVTTTRAGASPATNDDLAAQHETDIEADSRLFGLIDSADDTGAVNTVLAFAGVTGLTFSTAAPAPGTLTSALPTIVLADETPAGPTATVAYSSTLALATLGVIGAFPAHVWRLEVALEVVTAFGANRTITVGDADATDGLMGSTPVTLNTTGRTLAIAADAEYIDRYEGGLVPTVTIAWGASAAFTQGLAFVQINYAPHVSMTATAAA